MKNGGTFKTAESNKLSTKNQTKFILFLSVCNGLEASGGHKGVKGLGAEELEAVLQPLRDQQRQMTERLAKLQHSLDVMSYQQKERDSNSNINRDMVLLVVLVVMIQVSILIQSIFQISQKIKNS